uniref:Ig-like domain-containing protein n=1 Tax=Denticeps clupeoides TaxID=299321 RepID=A0AAY4CWL6_9TELE
MTAISRAEVNIMIFNTASFAALIFTMSGLQAYQLIQPKSQNAQLGENIQLHCREEGSDFSYIPWYQQKPGSAPTFLLVGSTRASGLPSRFSYSKNGYDEYLKIDGVTADDEAVYYCACPNCPTSGLYHSAPVY